MTKEKAIRIRSIATPWFLAIAATMSANCGAKTGLPTCGVDGVFCPAPTERTASKITCSCTCTIPTFPDPQGDFPVCFPPELNPYTGDPAAVNALPDYDTRVQQLCTLQTADFLSQLLISYNVPGICSDNQQAGPPGQCSCTPGPALDIEGCHTQGSVVPCDGDTCNNVFENDTIVPENCFCQTCPVGSDVCCPSTLSSSPVIFRPPPGSADPPGNGFGLLGGMLAAETVGSVDPALSTGTATLSFEDDLDFDHSDTQSSTLDGRVRLYGRPSSDGSAQFILDLGLTASPFTFHFSNVNGLASVDVAVTDVVLGGGTGANRIQFDANGNGIIPAGILAIHLEVKVNGDRVILNRTNPNDVAMHIDLAAGEFTIPALPFQVPGLSGSFAVSGQLDNQPPAANAGDDQVVECTTPLGAPVSLTGAVVDSNGNVILVAWYEDVVFDATKIVASTLDPVVFAKYIPPAATTIYTLQVQDEKFQMDLDRTNITVRDTTPPTLDLTVDPGCLWSPAHSLVLFELGTDLIATADDACDTDPFIRIVGVVSSQSDSAAGSGSTSGDVLFGEQAFCVRSERNGSEIAPREYTAFVEATDAAGNTTIEEISVLVGHDQGGPNCSRVDRTRIVAEGDPRCTAD